MTSQRRPFSWNLASSRETVPPTARNALSPPPPSPIHAALLYDKRWRYGLRFDRGRMMQVRHIKIFIHHKNGIATYNEKSARRRRKHCVLAVVRRSQKISPRHTPLPGGAGRPKFNQLETVTTFIYKLSLVRIDERNFELSWYHTHPKTHKRTNLQTHRQDRLKYTAPQLSAQCNEYKQ